jgi:hypothetical protein
VVYKVLMHGTSIPVLIILDLKTQINWCYANKAPKAGNTWW